MYRLNIDSLCFWTCREAGPAGRPVGAGVVSLHIRILSYTYIYII